MPDKVEASEIYCPECNDNYDIAWSEENESMYVVCGCGEAEKIVEFHDRFTEEYSGADDIRGYQ